MCLHPSPPLGLAVSVCHDKNEPLQAMALFWVPGPLPYDYPASLQHSWHPGRYCYYALPLRFAEEKAGAQRGEVIWPGVHSWWLQSQPAGL